MSYFLKNAVTASNQREIRKINMHIRAITSMTSQKKKRVRCGGACSTRRMLSFLSLLVIALLIDVGVDARFHRLGGRLLHVAVGSDTGGEFSLSFLQAGAARSVESVNLS